MIHKSSPALKAAMLMAGAFAAPAHAQDAAAGGALFKQRCQICHSVQPGAPAGLAPNLSGVVGRRAATTKFAYSPALTKSGLVWDKATLDRFLTAPMKLVPGTRMVIALTDAKQRGDVIAYLGATRK